jgi:hypothetical protein
MVGRLLPTSPHLQVRGCIVAHRIQLAGQDDASWRLLAHGEELLLRCLSLLLEYRHVGSGGGQPRSGYPPRDVPTFCESRFLVSGVTVSRFLRNLAVVLLSTFAVLLPHEMALGETLIIDLSIVDGELAIRTKMGQAPASPVRREEGLLDRLWRIFFMLECWNNADCGRFGDADHSPLEAAYSSEELTNLLETAGTALLRPMAAQIRRASRVEIRLGTPLLPLPIDAVYFDDLPLFAQKAILYTFAETPTLGWSRPATSWRGLLISDKETDPERGVLGVLNLFPKSTYFDEMNVGLQKLRAIVRHDFLALSAHGAIAKGPVDFIQLGSGEKLLAKDLARIAGRLVYLDSCNLAASASFLEAMRMTNVQFFLAPFLSNEAGNSSTRTMTQFFKELALGRHPVDALFKTRRQLFAHYRPGADLRWLLWRSAPFRIYALNPAR